MTKSKESPHERVRRICSAFADVTERPSHGTPTWFVAGKTFVQLWPDGHHDNDFPHLWCAAAPGVQQELVAANPRVFFRPPYVGHRGWIGVRLDQGAGWDEIGELCEDAYRAIAPKRLLTHLDDEPSTTS
ncbi:MAG TPA: MmcQ/YjbR family DNA-binding protein [Micromonosporaceae bacterium]